MSRPMPDFAGEFAKAADNAISLAVAGERARVLLNRAPGATPLSVQRLELLYELAYLRVFNQWEVFLEETFLRYLCGYTSSLGPAVMAGGSHYSSLADAETAVLGGRQYRLWHDPSQVINRARGFITNGLHEQIISSNVFRLAQFASIRHRIAHAQKHARIEFDRVTMSLAARRYRGGRPGIFLRDWQSPALRWLDAIVDELKNLATQITP